MEDLKTIIIKELSSKKDDPFFKILTAENSSELIYSLVQKLIIDGKINPEKKETGEVIFLEAPTGAGKDAIFLQLVHENPDKNYIELNLDMFRKYYVRYFANNQTFNDMDYVRITNQFTYEMFTILQEILLKYFPSSNIVITGSLRETEWNENFMKIYKQNNYKVSLVTVTISRQEGLYSIIKRYLEMVDTKRQRPDFIEGTVRYTSYNYFNETHEKFIDNFSYFVDLYNASPGKLIDTIKVYRRSKDLKDFKDDNLVYSSDINTQESPLLSVIRLRDAEYEVKEQDIAYIFSLIQMNRDYLEEQGTLKDLLLTIAALTSTETLYENKKRTI